MSDTSAAAASNDETPPSGRIPDEYVGHFRLLRTWTRKLQITGNRLKVLGEYLDQDSAPRAFMKIIVPIIPVVTTEFSLKWHGVHHKFAIELTKCLIEYWEKQKSQAEEEVTNLRSYHRAEMHHGGIHPHLPSDNLPAEDQNPSTANPEKKKGRRFIRRDDRDELNPTAVVNLSSTPLTRDEHRALQMGLSFIPTPRPPSNMVLWKEFAFFERRLRISHFFQDQDRPQSNRFWVPSAYTPRIGLSPSLEGFLSACNNAMIQQNQRPKKKRTQNLSNDLTEAMDSLQKRTDIVIKPADKGGAIVVWPKSAYVTEVRRQLLDHEHYEQVAGDLNCKYRNTIKSYLDSCSKRGWIPKKVVRYLTPTHYQVPVFYLLPKIHKDKIPVPGRPICSANDSPTERISMFVDHYIGPLARQVKSYLRDTQHFLQMLAEIPLLPAGSLLVTVDVSALYTNIPHIDGLKALKHYLNQRTDTSPHTFVLLTLARFVLTMNCFRFDEEFFRQIRGTAMGTKMAPNYAILFMAKLEEEFLSDTQPGPLVWWRYIDDIFMIWTHGRTTLESFLIELNNFHDTIKFTSEVGTEIPFLDTKVHLMPDGSLRTSLYTKPTDAHLYLHYTSAHPIRQINAIPIGQFLRIRRICSEEADYHEAAD